METYPKKTYSEKCQDGCNSEEATVIAANDHIEVESKLQRSNAQVQNEHQKARNHGVDFPRDGVIMVGLPYHLGEKRLHIQIFHSLDEKLYATAAPVSLMTSYDTVWNLAIDDPRRDFAQLSFFQAVPETAQENNKSGKANDVRHCRVLLLVAVIPFLKQTEMSRTQWKARVRGLTVIIFAIKPFAFTHTYRNHESIVKEIQVEWIH